MDADIFRNYLLYTEETEPPTVYHRWSYLTGLGAIIARKSFFAHGHFRIFPTIYTMLLGEPAARKSTAIKMMKKLFTASGYDTFAADKTSKEKFLLDLEGIDETIDTEVKGKNGKPTYDAVTADNLWGSSGEGEPREVFIVADEFNEFAGAGNLEFYTTLGNLWDFDCKEQPFTQRLKNSRSLSIYQPTISILAGNTPELFARAFPPEAIGSGFLSRLLLIHGERSGRRITFPPPPSSILGDALTRYLQKLRVFEGGEMERTQTATSMLEDIYQGEESIYIPDVRFKGYNNRRFTQLLKICTIIAAAKFQKEITDQDVLHANTILTHAEILMPKAMGEFGKSKNSDVANKVVGLVEQATAPLSVLKIWTQVRRDLGKEGELVDLLRGLVNAGKLQVVDGTGGRGYLPRKDVLKIPKYVDFQLLTREEREML